MPVLILGLDPGPTLTGAALIRDIGRAFLESSGHIENAAVYEWIAELEPDTVVAIELPSHVRGGVDAATAIAMGNQLLTTGKIGKDFRIAAERRGLRVVELLPYEWRRAVPHGKGAVGDKAVKAWLGMVMDGHPRRWNCHERDACGIAIVGAGKARKERAA